ncbi:hypothetical protein Vretifemale_7593, partial [Volvox reticuliferus]
SSRLLWGSFRQRTASRCLTSAPHVPLFASFQRALVMLAAYKLGLLRHLHIYESALVIPWRLHLANFSILGPFFQALFCGPGMTPSGPGSPGGLGGICTRGGLQLTYYFTDPGWFAELNRRGVAVVLFGCLNDERRFEICRSSGANAIATDAPSRLVAFLSGSGGGGGPLASLDSTAS